MSSVSVNSVRSSAPGIAGAVGDGIADDGPAIRYWLAQGGYLWFPPGTYRITATCPFTSSGTIAFGSGPAITSVVADDTAGNFGDMFTMTNLRVCGLAGLTLDAKALRSAGAALRISGGVSTFQLQSFGICNGGHSIDVDMNNQFDGVVFNDSASIGDWGTTIGRGDRKAMWRNFAAGGHGGVWFNSLHAASQVVNNIFMTSVTNNACCGVRYTGSGDVTLRSIQTLGMGGGFVADCTANPSASGDGLVTFDDCQWDTVAGGATFDNVLINLGGGVSGVVFINMGTCWVAGATGNGVHITGNTTPLLMTWGEGEAFSNGAWGINGVSHMTLGSTVLFNSNSSGNTTG